MKKQLDWDCRRWTVSPSDREPFNITTRRRATWVLKLLIVVGSRGTRPADGPAGLFSVLIGELRELGILIADLPGSSEDDRPGFRLACPVKPLEARD